ncbi:unnamed protein product [Amoebophrya sp. A120]|nr:unnamed protein product [Amoebophrya sp. A120]|eukprot:GSA120T00000721001.1
MEAKIIVTRFTTARTEVNRRMVLDHTELPIHLNKAPLLREILLLAQRPTTLVFNKEASKMSPHYAPQGSPGKSGSFLLSSCSTNKAAGQLDEGEGGATGAGAPAESSSVVTTTTSTSQYVKDRFFMQRTTSKPAPSPKGSPSSRVIIQEDGTRRERDLVHGGTVNLAPIPPMEKVFCADTLFPQQAIAGGGGGGAPLANNINHGVAGGPGPEQHLSAAGGGVTGGTTSGATTSTTRTTTTSEVDHEMPALTLDSGGSVANRPETRDAADEQKSPELLPGRETATYTKDDIEMSLADTEPSSQGPNSAAVRPVDAAFKNVIPAAVVQEQHQNDTSTGTTNVNNIGGQHQTQSILSTPEIKEDSAPAAAAVTENKNEESATTKSLEETAAAKMNFSNVKKREADRDEDHDVGAALAVTVAEVPQGDKSERLQERSTTAKKVKLDLHGSPTTGAQVEPLNEQGENDEKGKSSGAQEINTTTANISKLNTKVHLGVEDPEALLAAPEEERSHLASTKEPTTNQLCSTKMTRLEVVDLTCTKTTNCSETNSTSSSPVVLDAANKDEAEVPDRALLAASSCTTTVVMQGQQETRLAQDQQQQEQEDHRHAKIIPEMKIQHEVGRSTSQQVLAPSSGCCIKNDKSSAGASSGENENMVPEEQMLLKTAANGQTAARPANLLPRPQRRGGYFFGAERDHVAVAKVEYIDSSAGGRGLCDKDSSEDLLSSSSCQDNNLNLLSPGEDENKKLLHHDEIKDTIVLDHGAPDGNKNGATSRRGDYVWVTFKNGNQAWFRAPKYIRGGEIITQLKSPVLKPVAVDVSTRGPLDGRGPLQPLAAGDEVKATCCSIIDKQEEELPAVDITPAPIIASSNRGVSSLHPEEITGEVGAFVNVKGSSTSTPKIIDPPEHNLRDSQTDQKNGNQQNTSFNIPAFPSSSKKNLNYTRFDSLPPRFFRLSWEEFIRDLLDGWLDEYIVRNACQVKADAVVENKLLFVREQEKHIVGGNTPVALRQENEKKLQHVQKDLDTWFAAEHAKRKGVDAVLNKGDEEHEHDQSGSADGRERTKEIIRLKHTCFPIPQVAIAMIIGNEGRTVNCYEEKSGCYIGVRHESLCGKAYGIVEIVGFDAEIIYAVEEDIHQMVDRAIEMKSNHLLTANDNLTPASRLRQVQGNRMKRTSSQRTAFFDKRNTSGEGDRDPDEKKNANTAPVEVDEIDRFAGTNAGVAQQQCIPDSSRTGSCNIQSSPCEDHSVSDEAVDGSSPRSPASKRAKSNTGRAVTMVVQRKEPTSDQKISSVATLQKEQGLALPDVLDEPCSSTFSRPGTTTAGPASNGADSEEVDAATAVVLANLTQEQRSTKKMNLCRDQDEEHTKSTKKMNLCRDQDEHAKSISHEQSVVTVPDDDDEDRALMKEMVASITYTNENSTNSNTNQKNPSRPPPPTIPALKEPLLTDHFPFSMRYVGLIIGKEGNSIRKIKVHCELAQLTILQEHQLTNFDFAKHMPTFTECFADQTNGGKLNTKLFAVAQMMGTQKQISTTKKVLKLMIDSADRNARRREQQQKLVSQGLAHPDSIRHEPRAEKLPGLEFLDDDRLLDLYHQQEMVYDFSQMPTCSAGPSNTSWWNKRGAPGTSTSLQVNINVGGAAGGPRPGARGANQYQHHQHNHYYNNASVLGSGTGASFIQQAGTRVGTNQHAAASSYTNSSSGSPVLAVAGGGPSSTGTTTTTSAERTIGGGHLEEEANINNASISKTATPGAGGTDSTSSGSEGDVKVGAPSNIKTTTMLLANKNTTSDLGHQSRTSTSTRAHSGDSLNDTISFEVPKRYLGLLIGKKGDSIRRWREEASHLGIEIVVEQATSPGADPEANGVVKIRAASGVALQEVLAIAQKQKEKEQQLRAAQLGSSSNDDQEKTDVEIDPLCGLADLDLVVEMKDGSSSCVGSTSSSNAACSALSASSGTSPPLSSPSSTESGKAIFPTETKQEDEIKTSSTIGNMKTNMSSQDHQDQQSTNKLSNSSTTKTGRNVVQQKAQHPPCMIELRSKMTKSLFNTIASVKLSQQGLLVHAPQHGSLLSSNNYNNYVTSSSASATSYPNHNHHNNFSSFKGSASASSSSSSSSSYHGKGSGSITLSSSSSSSTCKGSGFASKAGGSCVTTGSTSYNNFYNNRMNQQSKGSFGKHMQGNSLGPNGKGNDKSHALGNKGSYSSYNKDYRVENSHQSHHSMSSARSTTSHDHTCSSSDSTKNNCNKATSSSTSSGKNYNHSSKSSTKSSSSSPNIVPQTNRRESPYMPVAGSSYEHGNSVPTVKLSPSSSTDGSTAASGVLHVKGSCGPAMGPGGVLSSYRSGPYDHHSAAFNTYNPATGGATKGAAKGSTFQAVASATAAPGAFAGAAAQQWNSYIGGNYNSSGVVPSANHGRAWQPEPSQQFPKGNPQEHAAQMNAANGAGAREDEAAPSQAQWLEALVNQIPGCGAGTTSNAGAEQEHMIQEIMGGPSSTAVVEGASTSSMIEKQADDFEKWLFEDVIATPGAAGNDTTIGNLLQAAVSRENHQGQDPSCTRHLLSPQDQTGERTRNIVADQNYNATAKVEDPSEDKNSLSPPTEDLLNTSAMLSSMSPSPASISNPESLLNDSTTGTTNENTNRNKKNDDFPAKFSSDKNDAGVNVQRMTTSCRAAAADGNIIDEDPNILERSSSSTTGRASGVVVAQQHDQSNTSAPAQHLGQPQHHLYQPAALPGSCVGAGGSSTATTGQHPVDQQDREVEKLNQLADQDTMADVLAVMWNCNANKPPTTSSPGTTPQMNMWASGGAGGDGPLSSTFSCTLSSPTTTSCNITPGPGGVAQPVPQYFPPGAAPVGAMMVHQYPPMVQHKGGNKPGCSAGVGGFNFINMNMPPAAGKNTMSCKSGATPLMGMKGNFVGGSCAWPTASNQMKG